MERIHEQKPVGVIYVNSHTYVGNADIAKGEGKSHDITGRVTCLTAFSLYVTWKSPQRLHTFLGYFSSLESVFFYSVCSVDGLLIDQWITVCPQIPVLGPAGDGWASFPVPGSLSILSCLGWKGEAHGKGRIEK